MGKNIISTGKDYNETAAPIQDMQEITKMELDIEAFEMVSTQKLKKESRDYGGMAWVKDGQIYCTHAPNQYPMVAPCTGLELLQNGNKVKEATIIKEGDLLEVVMEEETVEPSWTLRISENEMTAYLDVVPGKRVIRSIKDCPPSNFLQLELEEKKVHVPIDGMMIKNKLIELGITTGIDYIEIGNACYSENPDTFIIAKGIEPKPGQDGVFVPVQELDVKIGLKEREDGTVDYREIREFPTVDYGQVIGTIHPPQPGEAGQSVQGKLVPPAEVHPLHVVANKGIEIVDGSKIVAKQIGQPVIKMKGRVLKVTVVPKLTVSHDVSLKSGNVRYAGAVDILGSVQDGMLVEAKGSVMVQGNINMAKVFSEESIIIQRNIITSELSAGKSNAAIQEIYPLIEKCLIALERILAALEQVIKTNKHRISLQNHHKIGELLKVLLNEKFKTFPNVVENIVSKMKHFEEVFEPEWQSICKKLSYVFVTPYFVPVSIEQLSKLNDKMKSLAESLNVDRENQDVFIQSKFIQNSKLYSSGDIIVTGEGVYNSQLYSMGNIQIHGCVRGGVVYAQNGISIREAGTKGGGNPTLIHVPFDQIIEIDLALEGTKVQVGNASKTLDQTYHFLKVKQDNRGFLKLG